MSPVYGQYRWKFDAAKWARTVRKLTKDSVQEWAALVGVNATTLSGWRNMDRPNRNPHPSIANFLLICNELELDPRDFWSLDIPEDDNG